MKLPTIKKIKNLKGKRVLLRLGLNAVIKNDKVMGGFRLKQVIPTIKYLKEKGAKVVIVGHIGRDGTQSLRPVVDYINRRTKIGFSPLVHENLNTILSNMKEGTALMLENLRSDSREMENDASFAKYLASFADVYVNDAFSVSHRKHASIVGVPKLLPSYIGFQFEREIEYLSQARKPKHPFLLILGGGKAETKIPLMKEFINIADYVFMGGVPSNAFFKENGYEIGESKVDSKNFGLEKFKNNHKLILPIDVVVKEKNGVSVVKKVDKISKTDSIQDAGPKTIELLEDIIKNSKFIIWNGPFGVYEQGYDKATVAILKFLAKSDSKTIIGGGDTLTLAFNLKIHNKFSFVSTGGGAMLDYLIDGDLPGINAIIKSKK